MSDAIRWRRPLIEVFVFTNAVICLSGYEPRRRRARLFMRGLSPAYITFEVGEWLYHKIVKGK